MINSRTILFATSILALFATWSIGCSAQRGPDIGSSQAEVRTKADCYAACDQGPYSEHEDCRYECDMEFELPDHEYNSCHEDCHEDRDEGLNDCDSIPQCEYVESEFASCMDSCDTFLVCELGQVKCNSIGGGYCCPEEDGCGFFSGCGGDEPPEPAFCPQGTLHCGEVGLSQLCCDAISEECVANWDFTHYKYSCEPKEEPTDLEECVMNGGSLCEGAPGGCCEGYDNYCINGTYCEIREEEEEEDLYEYESEPPYGE